MVSKRTNRVKVIVMVSSVVLFTVLALSILCGPADAAEKRPLKLDFAYIPLPPESPTVIYWGWFCKEVDKRTNGKILITFHPGSLATNEQQIWQMVVTGAAGLGCPSGGVGTIYPRFELFGMPFIFRDYEHAYKVLDGKIGAQCVRDIESKYAVKVLTFYDYGFRHFFGKRPIFKLDDFKGMKLRVTNRTLGDFLSAAGGSPVFMSMGEVIPAIQQGALDGAELPMANILATKAYDVAKYCSLTFHRFGPGFLAMNRNIWNSLTPDEQKVVLQVAKEARDKQIEMYSEVQKKGKGILESKGMKVNAVDLKPFVELAVRAVYPKYDEKYGKGIIQQIVETK
jgi:tripartite ATP-independent transporter DctP family solute receptor